MAICCSLVTVCLLSLLFSGYGLLGTESEAVLEANMGTKYTEHLRVVEVKSLFPATTCETPSQSGAAHEGISLVHRRGPCFRLHRELSGSSLAFLRKKSGSQSPISLLSRDGEYVVSVSLGTPEIKLTLIFDTGSDVTWTQCKPCLHCYSQQDTLYDPNQSSTSYNLSISPPAYNIPYNDGSSSAGYYMGDTLRLGPSYEFPNFIFGCGKNNRDEYSSGATAGIFALGKGGDRSFLQQTASRFDQIYCYCIPSRKSANGLLYLGDKSIARNCPTDKFTPIVPSRDQYFVNLLSITIGNKTLLINSEVLIDSGTTQSKVPPQVYDELKTEFEAYMAGRPAFNGRDTCYNLTDAKTLTLPVIVLNFQGADVTLDSTALFHAHSENLSCFAFDRQNEGPVIIGSVQQRKLNVMFDINAGKVGFGAGNC